MPYRNSLGAKGKFHIPRALKQEMLRLKLVEEIEATIDFTLVVVSAPIGFGKTVGLAQWARAAGSGVAWLTLSEEDASPQALAQALAESIRVAHPLIMLDHFADIATVATLMEASALALAEDLNATDRNLRMVVDQAQYLSEDAARWLEVFCNGLSEGHQVILSGYGETRMRLGRMLAHGRAYILDPRRLLFSLEETDSYLSGRGYAGNTAAAHKELNGWPAGLALVGSGASPYTSPERLVYEVLDGLAPELRESLYQLSVLEVWSEEHVRALSLPLPEGWLASARDAGLPMVPTVGEAYRPHTLLLEALDSRLRRNPTRRQELHRLAAVSAERNKKPLSAIRHYLEAADFEAATRIAEQVVPEYEQLWEYSLIKQLLERFPEGSLSPILQGTLVNAYIKSGEPQKGELLAQKLYATEVLHKRGYFSLGVLAARRGDFSRVVELAQAGLAASGTDFLDNRLRRMKAEALLQLGAKEQALEEAQACVQWSQSTGNQLELGKSLSTLASTLNQLGLKEETEIAIHQALVAFEDVNFLVGTLDLYNELAELCRLSDRASQAINHIDKALGVPGVEGDPIHPVLLESKADAYIWLGDFASALPQLEGALAKNVSLKSRLLDRRILYKLAEALCRLGELEAADRRVIQARAIQMAETPMALGVRNFYEAIYAFHRGHLESARQRFEEAVNGPLSADRAVRAQLYIAAIAREHGSLSADHLGAFEEALQRLGTDGVLVTDAALLGEALDDFVTLGFSPERWSSVTQSIRKDTSEASSIRLEVFTLGEFRAEIDGSFVKVQNSKAREILVWLALNGAGTREQIVDALWDGSDDQKHVDYFKVSVRRLRSALSEHMSVRFNPLLFEDGLYRLSPRFGVTIDVLEIENYLAKGAIADLERVLELYRGPFLQLVEAEWVEPVRTRALDSTLIAADTLGTRLIEDDPPRSVTAFQRALELDPYSEAAYVRLMRAHKKAGDDRSAKLAYSELVRMLAEEFGASPDPSVEHEFGNILT